MSSKSPLNRYVWKSSISWDNSIKLTFLGCPQKFYHSVMYIAPSSGHELLKLNLPFKLILRRFEVVFWCLEWECSNIWRTDGNSFKFTNTITALCSFFTLIQSNFSLKNYFYAIFCQTVIFLFFPNIKQWHIFCKYLGEIFPEYWLEFLLVTRFLHVQSVIYECPTIN